MERRETTDERCTCPSARTNCWGRQFTQVIKTCSICSLSDIRCFWQVRDQVEHRHPADGPRIAVEEAAKDARPRASSAAASGSLPPLKWFYQSIEAPTAITNLTRSYYKVTPRWKKWYLARWEKKGWCWCWSCMFEQQNSAFVDAILRDLRMEMNEAVVSSGCHILRPETLSSRAL